MCVAPVPPQPSASDLSVGRDGRGKAADGSLVGNGRPLVPPPLPSES